MAGTDHALAHERLRRGEVTDSDDCPKGAAKETNAAHAGKRPPVLVVGAAPMGLLLAADFSAAGCHSI